MAIQLLFSIYASSTHPHRWEHNSNVFYTVSHHVSLYHRPASLRHTNTQHGDDTGTQLSSSHNSNLNWSRQRECLLLHCQRFQWILNGRQTASRGRTWPCIIHQTKDSSCMRKITKKTDLQLYNHLYIVWENRQSSQPAIYTTNSVISLDIISYNKEKHLTFERWSR